MKNRILHHYGIVITAGFAMFSMFFGAGNLVFPLALGVESVDDSVFSSIGLFLTGIFVPFLGLMAIVLYNGDRIAFFGCIGRKSSWFITTVILLLMGPFGGIPRCIAVAHGGFSLIMPELSIQLFSVIFCIVNLFVVWNHDRIVAIIGLVLTPWLLTAITTIIIAGFLHDPAVVPVNPEPLSNLQALNMGLLKGYHTLDLLAAFFFSATTIIYLRDHLKKHEAPTLLVPLSSLTSCLGALLLAAVYLGFVGLGARYAGILENVDPQQMLIVIAGEALGSYSMPVLSITIILACLTTVSVLVTLFSDFINEDVCKKKLGHHPAVIGTLVISFAVSLLGFHGLSQILNYILQVVYPALIALVIANILGKIQGRSYGRRAFWITTWVSLGIQLWHTLPAFALNI